MKKILFVFLFFNMTPLHAVQMDSDALQGQILRASFVDHRVQTSSMRLWFSETSSQTVPCYNNNQIWVCQMGLNFRLGGDSSLYFDLCSCLRFVFTWIHFNFRRWRYFWVNQRILHCVHRCNFRCDFCILDGSVFSSILGGI